MAMAMASAAAAASKVAFRCEWSRKTIVIQNTQRGPECSQDFWSRLESRSGVGLSASFNPLSVALQPSPYAAPGIGLRIGSGNGWLYSGQSKGLPVRKCRAGDGGTNDDDEGKARTKTRPATLQHAEASSLLRLDGWDVPWDYGLTLVGTLAWLVSFLLTGLATALLSQNLGVGRRQLLDLDEQAVYILIGQILQTIASLSTINLVVSKYKPLPSDFFVYDLRKPFDLQRGWLLWGGVGILGAGGAVVLTSIITSTLNGEPPPREQGDALSQLLPLIGASPFSTASLIVVTGVLAPLLEETVFRGFLLTSLTKRLPVPVAVLLSSAVFALVHLTPGEFPQLFALGIVMGFAYSRTHNLLTPILIHSVWNSGVVVVLTALRLEGYDLRDLLSS